jgi:predicted site-specific integrase-resolvase
MTVIHMNQRQLANRWGVSEATLERWRSDGIGPRYLKQSIRANEGNKSGVIIRSV